MAQAKMIKDAAGVDTALISMVYHTDGRVNAIEQQVGALGAQLSRIENHLMNKPPINYAAWISLAVTMFFGAIAYTYAISAYVNNGIEPLREELAIRSATITEFRTFKEEAHYEQGVEDEFRRWSRDIQKLHLDRLDRLDAEVDRIDAEGSRKWREDGK